jgi:hypothetical protein
MDKNSFYTSIDILASKNTNEDTKTCVDSPLWTGLHADSVELTQNYRYPDHPIFQRVLEHIFNGDLENPEVLDFLRSHSNDKPCC